MAVDAILDLKGVEGESAAKGFENKIQILAWSWGVSQSGTTHIGTGGGAGKVNVQDISITKYMDKSSPTLLLACCKGTHYDDATITMRKAGGDQLPYLIIKLKELIITSVSGGGSGGEDQQTENISLNFAEFEYSYQPQDAKGGKKGGAVTVKYDIAAVS